MVGENEAVVRKLAEDFNAGDIPAALGALDGQVEWNEPGGGQSPSGLFKGPQAVVEGAWSKVPQFFHDFKVVAEKIEGSGSTVTMIGRYVGQAKNGTALDTPIKCTFEVSDGKVVAFANEISDTASWKAAWS